MHSVPSIDKADVSRPSELHVHPGVVSISVPLSWWVIESVRRDASDTTGSSSSHDSDGFDYSKVSVLGIIDTEYIVKIRIDESLGTSTHHRSHNATVFVRRRNAVPLSPKKDQRLSRLWMDRSGSFRVEAEFKDVRVFFLSFSCNFF